MLSEEVEIFRWGVWRNWMMKMRRWFEFSIFQLFFPFATQSCFPNYNFHQEFMNAQFPHHALQNLLIANKRRKSESVDVPSISSSHSPRHEDLHHSHHQHHHARNSHNNNQIKNEPSPKYENEHADEPKIKRESASASNASDQNENEIDFQNHEFKMLGSSRKTMNDVLKLLTTKMRGSTLREGHKDSTEDFDGKTWVLAE